MFISIKGQLDIPLSENGINQAKLLAKTLQNIKWNEVLYFLHIHLYRVKIICDVIYNLFYQLAKMYQLNCRCGQVILSELGKQQILFFITWTKMMKN